MRGKVRGRLRGSACRYQVRLCLSNGYAKARSKTLTKQGHGTYRTSIAQHAGHAPRFPLDLLRLWVLRNRLSTYLRPSLKPRPRPNCRWNGAKEQGHRIYEAGRTRRQPCSRFGARRSVSQQFAIYKGNDAAGKCLRQPRSDLTSFACWCELSSITLQVWRPRIKSPRQANPLPKDGRVMYEGAKANDRTYCSGVLWPYRHARRLQGHRCRLHWHERALSVYPKALRRQCRRQGQGTTAKARRASQEGRPGRYPCQSKRLRTKTALMSKRSR